MPQNIQRIFIQMNQQDRQQTDLSLEAIHDTFPSPLKKKQRSRKIFTSILLISLLYLFYWSQRADDYTEKNFYNVMSVNQVKQLPFCLLVIPSQMHSSEKLMASIKNQKYTNFQVIYNLSSTATYFNFKTAIELQCKEYSVIMFVNSPLQIGALEFINNKFQRQKGWIAISQDQQQVQVIAFFFRIYEIFQSNDFNNTNKIYLQKNNREVQTLAFLQLCQDFKIKINKFKVIDPEDISYFRFKMIDKNKYQREKYQKILRLSQDFKVNISQIEQFKQKRLYENPRYGQNLRLIHMHKAIERQQLIFLPANHSIYQVERMQMNHKYQIDKYRDISKQVRFCVTMLSHNNIQNNRYLKVIRSILQQEYDNYHIVFIDDLSDDQNMKKTIEYFDKMKFPKNRLQFVQNLDRNYATYNILNAAFNFCHEDDIQLLMDGDDQFIGKTAFQVMNSAYQRKQDVWVAYSNYKTNFFIFGISQAYKSRLSHASGKNRLAGTFIGPIRTWRVKLVRSIPIQNHKMKDGNWLDTVYDDAIAHPLVQLAGFQKTVYIPEINYEYNTQYGGNDDMKGNHRIQVYYEHIIKLPVLDQLKSLADTTKDKDVEAELNEGLNKKYKILNI